MLAEGEVPVGARVHVYFPGHDNPDGVGGVPGVLVRLYNTFGEPNFYPLVGDRIDFHAARREFPEEVLFSPPEIHSLQGAAVNGRYAVFSGGKRMQHEVTNEREARIYSRRGTAPSPHPYEAVRGGNGLWVGCHFPFLSVQCNNICPFLLQGHLSAS